MTEKQDDFSYKTENTRSADNYPLIDVRYPLAMFYKKTLGKQQLLTLIQDKTIEFIVKEQSQDMYKSNSFQLFYVLSGQVTECIENKEYTYLAGQGCLLNRRIAHNDFIKDGHLLILDISERMIEELLEVMTIEQREQPIFSYLQQFFQKNQDWKRHFIEFNAILPIENQPFNKILDTIQVELSTQPLGSLFFQKGLVLRLLHALENPHFFTLRQVALDACKEDFLTHRLITLIEASHGNISRLEIEETLHYNSEYLNRLLKKRYQHTITSYSKIIRTQKAQQLLTTTDLTVAAIAEALNFSTEHYFYNFFKKETGFSPKQYRLKHQDSKNNF
ncbi:helix-turn-helix domain-containing protein [Streptococcus sp. S784/96/1]|uniref:helix-turn-helix domain-containing protein n=1 Tax=Streptococcus sp. S784/96/1 TaxID=2653499 RepID=UPI001386743F|nr:AraC family transcriptional regulator [Streptococcus sp. S784/96/1]